MTIKKIVLYVSFGALFILPLFALFPMPFWPFNFSDSFYFPFITGKAFYFRFLIELALASWVVLAFIDAKYRPKISGLTIAVTLFAFVALLADLLGVSPLRSLWSNFERMEGWITIVHLWAFYLVSTSLFGAGEEGKRMWHKWLNVSLGVALVVAIYGLFQLFGWAAIHQGSSRLDASLGNSAYMAVYMLFNSFIAAYMFFFSSHEHAGRPRKTAGSSGFPKWIYAILAILFTFILFDTDTCGTILGLVSGVMLALLIYTIVGKKEPKMRRMVSGGLFCFIVLLGVLFWFNRHQPFIERNPIFGRFSNISWSDASNQARQYIWPMALNGAMKRPLFGWGQENFNYIFNADYNPKMWSQEQWFDRAHNVFLDWLTASGIVGLLSYLSLYILFLVTVWKSSLSITEKSILTGLLAGYFVHNIFVFDNLASYVFFFAMLGFANSSKGGKPIVWLGKNPLRTDAVEYVVAPIAIVVLVAVIYFFEVRPIQANTRLIAALQSCGGVQANAGLFQDALDVNAYVANQEIREQLLTCAVNVISSQQISGPTKQEFYGLTMAEIQAQMAATPKDARIYVLGGAFLDGIGQYQEALPVLEKGHTLSPAKQTLDFELGGVYLNTGMADKGVEILKQAYESEPGYPQAKLSYSIALVIAGKEPEARAMFGNDPSIFNNRQMAQAYVMVKQYSKAIAVYRELLKANPEDTDTLSSLARVQYAAGLISDAVSTLRSIEKNHPELKDQIETAVKQIQK